MDAPPIQYARTDDGVNIAYWTLGEGPPLLHLINHAFSHVELEWRVPAIRDWYEKLATRFQVVRLDFRSSGLSDSVKDDLGIDAYVKDIEAVVAATQIDRASILAVSYACAVAMKFAARRPDDVDRMAFFCPSLTMHDSTRSAIEASRSMMRSDPDWWAKLFAATRTGNQDAGAHYERVIRNAVSPEIQPSLIDAYMAMDVREDAPSVQCPTLIASGRFMQTAQSAREVATAIPSAKLTVFDIDAEDPYFAEPQQVLDAILPFLSEGLAEPEAELAPTATSGPDLAATGLTNREIEVIRLVAQGLSNGAIGEQLVISSATVARHVSNILNKTSLANRVELARFASESGLL
jgi:pimeloyl-ACP methyl ester carboxylesterase/DNA-binding CsgD family transcriptional regulator